MSTANSDQFVDSTNEDSIMVDNAVIERNPFNTSKNRVEYSDLLKTSNDLIRFVSNDQKKYQYVLSSLLYWTKLLKEGHNFSIEIKKSSFNFKPQSLEVIDVNSALPDGVGETVIDGHSDSHMDLKESDLQDFSNCSTCHSNFG